MKILCIHGVGDHSSDTSWQKQWKDALGRAIQNVGGGTPDVDFVMHDEIFERYPLDAATWAKAAALLAASGIEHAVGDAWQESRGWLDTLGSRLRWTAGMVVQWAAEPALRSDLRSAILRKARDFRPDVILGHSLGSLGSYDLLVQSDLPEELRKTAFVSIGSQIGNVAVRNVFAGRLVMPRIGRWFHFYNPNDRVLTEPVKLYEESDDFAQIVTSFDIPNDMLNHDAVWYILNPRAADAWRELSGAPPAGRGLVARPQRIRPQRREKALVVGIDEYADPSHNLQGCVNDAYLVSQMLQETGFAAENIRLLLNKRATTAAIRDRLEWLLGDVHPDDIRYFHFSGHGARLPAYGNDEVVDHFDECMVPFDFDFTPAHAIVDKWFYQLYSQLPYSSRFIATLDCCHSGGLTRSGARIRGLDLPEDILHRVLRWDRPADRWVDRSLPPVNPSLTGLKQYAGPGAASMRLGRAVMLRELPDAQFDDVRTRLGHRGPFLPMLFEACAVEELAEEFRDGNVSYGAFTYAVMTCLREARAKGQAISYNELIRRTRQLLEQLGKPQHPQVVGPANELDEPIPMTVAPPPAAAAAAPAAGPPSLVELAVEQNRDKLLKLPGAIHVRAGYKFKNAWITKERAVVVTVRRKFPIGKLPRKEDRIPKTVPVTDAKGKTHKVPVDVAPASPLEQLVADRLTVDDLTDDNARQERAFLGIAAAGGSARGISEPYQKPGPALQKRLNSVVSEKMEVVCHTSPDGSFSVLREFLQGTGKRLTMGIFDLTAPHVVEALKESLEAPPRKFLLVLDPKIALGNGGSGDNPKAKDLEETAVRDDLEAALRDRFEFVWAAVKLRGKTNGGLFDSAYHIKVAVRDGKSFWLSSGNLQSTNQPDHDLPPKPAANDLRRFNREWHVIVHNPTLAAVLEDYVQFDFQQAQRFQAETGERAFAPQFDLLVPRGVSRPRLLKTFRPKTFAKKVTVRALLTPDNYGPAVLELIESAKKTVYFQNQYIHLGPANKRPKGFQDLCTALKKKIDAGKDVRIILRDLGDTRKMLEELEDFGIPGDNIRLQVACHNKGIVVDSQQVLVGSHNWSGAGTTTNRDASLIFDDPDVAKYYEEVFRYDWENQARQVSSGERAMPVAIPRGIRVTAEHVRHFPSGVPVYRVSWDDYFEG